MAKKIFMTSARLRKTAIGAGSLFAMLLLESCYSTTVSMGAMEPTDPAVEVNTAHNGHFIGGLVNATKVEDDVYVGENKDYLTKTYVSVGDAIVSFLSGGLFAPTTTKFYLPYGSEMPPKVKMPPVKFGVRGGFNLSAPTGSGHKPKTGFKAGVILDVPMTHSVYFQPGLYYSQKGGEVNGEKQSQDYFEIPFLLSYRFGVPNILASVTNGSSFTKNMQLQAHFGPYVGLCKKNDFGHTHGDVGLQAGIGGLFLKHIYIGLSYDYGFMDLEKSWNNSSKSYNSNFSIVAGFNL